MTETASRVNASAISATTSACDSLRTAPPAVARTPSVRTAFGGVRVACQSGARLVNALATSASPSPNASTFQSMTIASGTYSEPATTITRTSTTLSAAPAGGTDHRDGGRFGEIPQREVSAPGAERDSNRGFTTPGHGPRQQQRRDVRAGDEQQHACRGKQQQERGAELAERVLPQVEHRRRVPWVRRRIEARDVGSSTRGIRLRLLQRHAGFPPGVREVDALALVLTPSGRIEVHPDVGRRAPRGRSENRKPELRRHHAGHGQRTIVERDRLADDAGIAAEARPQRRRNHHAALVSEPLPQPRWPEIPGQRRRDGGAVQVLRLARRSQVEVGEPEPAEHVEARRPGLILDEIGKRARGVATGLVVSGAVKDDETLAFRERERCNTN